MTEDAIVSRIFLRHEQSFYPRQKELVMSMLQEAIRHASHDVDNDRPQTFTVFSRPTRKLGLTKQMSAVLQFIKTRIEDTGVSPSYDEIRDAMGLSSKSGIHRLVTSLEDRGYIVRKYGGVRSIHLVEDHT